MNLRFGCHGLWWPQKLLLDPFGLRDAQELELDQGLADVKIARKSSAPRCIRFAMICLEIRESQILTPCCTVLYLYDETLSDTSFDAWAQARCIRFEDGRDTLLCQ